MRSLSLFTVAPTLALLGAASACGPGILSPATPPPPLFHLEVQTTSTLTVSGDVRGALAWSVYSDELVACMDALEVNGRIDLDFDDDTGLPEPVAYQLVRRMQSCLQFSERGHVETDSVAVEPQFPSSFTIPVAALPSEHVLTGHPGARLGIGDVLVYLDDGDGTFSETPLGAGAFIDRVVGTSIAYREDDEDESFLVWREGELSSIWKLYRGIYGCPDPAEGFSTVTVRLLDVEPYVDCVVDDAAVPVELDDSAVASLACAADPDRHVPQRPSDNVGLPASAEGVCVDAGDGWRDVRYTIDPESVCPDFERYDLVGCSDLTSEAACRATSWDLAGDEPGWWPCRSFSSALSLYVSDAASALTSGVDDLFELALSSGFASFALDDVVVVIERPEGDLVLGSEALTLHDEDNNGVWNSGDTVTVRELDGASFTASVVPGSYPVHVSVSGVEIVSAFGPPAWQPVALPVITPLDMTAVDAPAVLTFGADEIALVTWSAVDRAPIAIEDVRAHCYIGGELPVSFGATAAEGAVVLAADADEDGLFSRGDTLLLVERDNVGFGLDPDGFASFGGVLYCGLSIDVGFNAFVHAASFVVGLDGTPLDE